mmetsp:Transcript_23493/g.33684  ORF Transcript_23493/g.33684 Transcript_23493/m.33684 type:complete len:205 (-) Transcript_23493:90-704(-)
MDLIERSSQHASSPSMKNRLQTLATLGNVPRKEKQFRNFCGNSLNLRQGGGNVVTEIWTFLSELRNQERAEEEKRKAEEDETRKKQKEVEEAAKERHKKEKDSTTESDSNKKKNDDVDQNKSSVSPEKLSAKKVRKTMKKVLKKNTHQKSKSMKLKLLRREVQALLGLGDCDNSNKKLLKKMLENEISSYKKVKIDGKVVSILS